MRQLVAPLRLNAEIEYSLTEKSLLIFRSRLIINASQELIGLKIDIKGDKENSTNTMHFMKRFKISEIYIYLNIFLFFFK